ncbi:hypothetical protein GUITHDRAFT_103111 [Guillardia theta CCMP2712]|uniref:Beta-galactosidase n=1 Tax=Guillardia theta (strain CCMP2712) TaxID=905079 RepID=L1JSM7_GUITC|nr:hypothetical protein GUITHDRAFT_103111 [Guillardia theta CCMP2712]EKX51195.1 hypothetical protein GUITHDRAFT_103111 [Guillardia theta CCMP2712]|eukprot:XP_005838175.1 hypothetical protein GUITHDRAFT_103111 [Guillardia theta CCMP2712]
MAVLRPLVTFFVAICIFNFHADGFPLVSREIHAELAGDQKRSFSIKDNKFYKDGQPFQIFAGELHYFRIPKAYWRDRMQRVKALGFNAIQTYVAWNFHESKKRQYRFSGSHNVEEFMALAHELGAEWEFGGFPSWLLKNQELVLRTYEPNYIQEVEIWFRRFLYQHGGPVIMIQIENEFGSYGDVSKIAADRKYLNHLIHLCRSLLGPQVFAPHSSCLASSDHVLQVILYTTDFGDINSMRRGSLNGSVVLSAGDFGPSGNVTEAMLAQLEMNPKGLAPLFCSEYYPGWYSVWGQANVSRTSTRAAVTTLRTMIEQGFSFSMYMVHGGTNFGFWSGANILDNSRPYQYASIITSYDYSSPISECGEHGVGSDNLDKFEALQSLLRNFSRTPLPPEPPAIPLVDLGTVQLPWKSSLWDVLDKVSGIAVSSQRPLPFELINADYGFVLYSRPGISLNSRENGEKNLTVGRVKDRAQVFMDREFAAVMSRHEEGPSVASLLVGPDQGIKQLDILVENLGRVNYGQFLTDSKGLFGPVFFGDDEIEGDWLNLPLVLDPFPLEALRAALRSRGAGGKERERAPLFLMGEFKLRPDQIGDTFISTRKLGKGYLWLNGINLGMYWEEMGPQHDLYVPASFLKQGVNDVIALELELSFENYRGSVRVAPEILLRPKPPTVGSRTSSA